MEAFEVGIQSYIVPLHHCQHPDRDPSDNSLCVTPYLQDLGARCDAADPKPLLLAIRGARCPGETSQGRHFHSTLDIILHCRWLPLNVTPHVICTVILLSLLSFSVKNDSVAPG